jgi:hypothetical protein
MSAEFVLAGIQTSPVLARSKDSNQVPRVHAELVEGGCGSQRENEKQQSTLVGQVNQAEARHS